MATTTTTPLADVPSFEQVTQQVRDLADQAREYSELVLSNAKTFGNYALDAYEQVASTVLDAQAKAVDSVKVDWLPSIVPAALDANVKFNEDVTAAYVKAVRATLA